MSNTHIQPGDYRGVRHVRGNISNDDSVSRSELASGNVQDPSHISCGQRRPHAGPIRHWDICFSEPPVSGIEPGVSALTTNRKSRYKELLSNHEPTFKISVYTIKSLLLVVYILLGSSKAQKLTDVSPKNMRG